MNLQLAACYCVMDLHNMERNPLSERMLKAQTSTGARLSISKPETLNNLACSRHRLARVRDYQFPNPKP
jgi:hypothetical protein